MPVFRPPTGPYTYPYKGTQVYLNLPELTFGYTVHGTLIVFFVICVLFRKAVLMFFDCSKWYATSLRIYYCLELFVTKLGVVCMLYHVVKIADYS